MEGSSSIRNQNDFEDLYILVSTYSKSNNISTLLSIIVLSHFHKYSFFKLFELYVIGKLIYIFHIVSYCLLFHLSWLIHLVSCFFFCSIALHNFTLLLVVPFCRFFFDFVTIENIHKIKKDSSNKVKIRQLLDVFWTPYLLSIYFQSPGVTIITVADLGGWQGRLVMIVNNSYLYSGRIEQNLRRTFSNLIYVWMPS